ncbi:MAG: ABC transporter ATP-binding protein [Patescibacteria group bacterium]
MKPIIQVKNVGKKYDIKHYQGKYVALRDVIMTILQSPFKFMYKKAKVITGRETKEEFWALKDISFDVMAGEVIGIIGRNGAGKSTLLKILTGITPPSSGEIRMYGHVASLLEVGTGFHPELTGRENMFLNGAILGMKKKDISEKFDQIVEFAGIEKFIDTPVKYYSSGMYVRLAFSVAAHMEPDILLVDEVLAVGDAEFQKKCLGKMEEVTRKQGRTILFVSHNMAAIQSLCKKCILIEKGKIKMIGNTDEIVNQYLNSNVIDNIKKKWPVEKRPGNDIVSLISTRLISHEGETLSYVYSNKEVGVEIVYEVKKSGYLPIPNIHIFTNKGDYAFISHADYNPDLDNLGIHKSVAWIPENILNNGTYIIGIAISTMMPLQVHLYEHEAIIFQVIEDINSVKKFDYNQRIPGILRPKLKWDLE